MHKIPLTSMEEDGLRNHRLPIGTPSQLSDCFRQGMAWALSQASHVVELKVDYLPPQQAAVRDILSGIDATENESPDGWWETTTGADFGKWKLDEVLAVLGQAAQPVELAALVAERDDALALAASRLADWDSMRQQWVEVMAERDAKAEHVARLIQELDIACALSLKADAERDALRQDAERYRWLRDKNSGYVYSTAYLHGVSASKDTGCDIFSVEEVPALLDAEIDRRRNYNAAMGEQK